MQLCLTDLEEYSNDKWELILTTLCELLRYQIEARIKYNCTYVYIREQCKALYS